MCRTARVHLYHSQKKFHLCLTDHQSGTKGVGHGKSYGWVINTLQLLFFPRLHINFLRWPGFARVMFKLEFYLGRAKDWLKSDSSLVACGGKRHPFQPSSSCDLKTNCWWLFFLWGSVAGWAEITVGQICNSFFTSLLIKLKNTFFLVFFMRCFVVVFFKLASPENLDLDMVLHYFLPFLIMPVKKSTKHR